MINTGDVVWVVFINGDFILACKDESTAWTEAMAGVAACWAEGRTGTFDPHVHMSSSYSQGTTYLWVTGDPNSIHSYWAEAVR